MRTDRSAPVMRTERSVPVIRTERVKADVLRTESPRFGVDFDAFHERVTELEWAEFVVVYMPCPPGRGAAKEVGVRRLRKVRSGEKLWAGAPSNKTPKRPPFAAVRFGSVWSHPCGLSE
jgi:hypothetical protein